MLTFWYNCTISVHSVQYLDDLEVFLKFLMRKIPKNSKQIGLRMEYLFTIWLIYNADGNFTGTSKLPTYYQNWTDFPTGSLIPINYRGKIYRCRIESLWNANYCFKPGFIENLEIEKAL